MKDTLKTVCVCVCVWLLCVSFVNGFTESVSAHGTFHSGEVGRGGRVGACVCACACMCVFTCGCFGSYHEMHCCSGSFLSPKSAHFHTHKHTLLNTTCICLPSLPESYHPPLTHTHTHTHLASWPAVQTTSPLCVATGMQRRACVSVRQLDALCMFVCASKKTDRFTFLK